MLLLINYDTTCDEKQRPRMLLHLQPYVLRYGTAHGILQSDKRTNEAVERLHMQRARMATDRRRIKKIKL